MNNFLLITSEVLDLKNFKNILPRLDRVLRGNNRLSTSNWTKIGLVSLLICITTDIWSNNSDAFITTWKTTVDGESITIPTIGSGYEYTIAWGDGSLSYYQTGNTTHVYETAGTYTVILVGDFPRIYFNNTGDKDKIQSIEQWGNGDWTSMSHAFHGCTQLVNNATDRPDLKDVTDMSYMFTYAQAFKGQMDSWDVRYVTDMSWMLAGTDASDADLRSWNVGNVTDMSYMFLSSNFNLKNSPMLASGVAI